MESTSTIHTSPTYNTNSSNNITIFSDKVVLELSTQNNFNDDYINTSSHTKTINLTEEEAPDEDEQEFEFPVMCADSNLRQSSSESVSDDQISLRYPVFDRSLLSDIDLNTCNGVSSPITESEQTLEKRLSLINLFDEDRETTSSSSSDELDGVTPGTYCVWKPKTDPNPDPDPKRKPKHKKSNSVSIDNTSNRWKVRDLLKRSYSDDNYSSSGKDIPVLLFIPPVSPNQKNGEKVNKIGKSGKLGFMKKTERNIPVNRGKVIGNVVRFPPYLPYREDQLAAYANFTGLNKNIY